MNTTIERKLPQHPIHLNRPDEFIQQEVAWYLTQNGYLDGRDFTITVDQGVVTIEGEVPTKTQKKMALECIQHISGIIHIENRLKIKRVSRFSDGHSMHGF